MSNKNVLSSGEHAENKICSNRIEWVDIFKGLAIILMVLGHSGSPITIYIYLFHMPAFMFISGYTVNVEKYSAFSYIKRKFITILLPFIVINFSYIAFYGLLHEFNILKYVQSIDTFSFDNSIRFIFKYQSTPDLGGATWFLIALFGMEIIYMLIYKMAKIIRLSAAAPFIGIGCGIIGYFFAKRAVQPVPFLLDLAMYGLMFYSIGSVFSKFKVFEQEIDKRFMLIVSVIAMIVLKNFTFMNWPTRSFDFEVNILSSLAGIFLLYCFSNYFTRSEFLKKLLSSLGRMTLTVLMLHFAMFKIISFILIVLKLYPPSILKDLVPPAGGGLIWLLYTVFCLLLCFLLSTISKKTHITNFIINGKLPKL